jgi:hypothetical protein
MSARPIDVVPRAETAVLHVLPTPRLEGPEERRASWLNVSPLDVALVIGMFVVAILRRLPMLIDVPSFTDETIEVQFGLQIYRGELFPLTNADTY